MVVRLAYPLSEMDIFIFLGELVRFDAHALSYIPRQLRRNLKHHHRPVSTSSLVTVSVTLVINAVMGVSIHHRLLVSIARTLVPVVLGGVSGIMLWVVRLRRAPGRGRVQLLIPIACLHVCVCDYVPLVV